MSVQQTVKAIGERSFPWLEAVGWTVFAIYLVLVVGFAWIRRLSRKAWRRSELRLPALTQYYFMAGRMRWSCLRSVSQ